MKWNQRLTNLMATMEKELGIGAKGKGMSKGKGKGGKGGKGKGEGKSNAMTTTWTSTKPSNSASCFRCGKDNHHESNCYHRDKVCDHCHKTGHVKAACRLLNEASTPTTTIATTTPTNAPPWTCFTCFASNADSNMNKCGKCKAKRIVKTEDKKEDSEKTMIDKKILKVLDGSGLTEKMDIGTEGDADIVMEDNEEREKLTTLISTAKTLGLASAVKEAEEKLEALDKKNKDKQPSLLKTTRTAKEVIAEKMRLLKQHEERSNNLQLKKENATAARIRQAEEKEKAKQREEERHKAAMAMLDEEFAQAEQYQTNLMEEAAEDLKKTNEQYHKDILKLDEYMKVNSISTEVPTPAAKEMEKEEDIDKTPEKEAIIQHLIMDSGLAGKEMTPELIAESFVKMMNNLKQGTKRNNTDPPELPDAKRAPTSGQQSGSQAGGGRAE